jgi:Ca2+/Na+ antiporter
MTLWHGRMRDLDAYLGRHVIVMVQMLVVDGKVAILDFVWILGMLWYVFYIWLMINGMKIGNAPEQNCPPCEKMPKSADRWWKNSVRRTCSLNGDVKKFVADHVSHNSRAVEGFMSFPKTPSLMSM